MLTKFVVIPAGGGPCEPGNGKEPAAALKAYFAREFFGGRAKIVNIDAARKADGQLDEDDFRAIVEQVVTAESCAHFMIPIGPMDLCRAACALGNPKYLPVEGDIAKMSAKLAAATIVFWTTAKFFSNNKQLSPIALGAALGVLSFLACQPEPSEDEPRKGGGIWGFYRTDLFNPHDYEWNEQRQLFVRKKEAKP